MNGPEWPRKGAATRIGVDPDEYLARRDAGEMWCSGCQGWHDESLFHRTKRGYCRESYLRMLRERAAQRERDFRNHLLARLLVK